MACTIIERACLWHIDTNAAWNTRSLIFHQSVARSLTSLEEHLVTFEALSFYTFWERQLPLHGIRVHVYLASRSRSTMMIVIVCDGCLDCEMDRNLSGNMSIMSESQYFAN